MKAADATQIQQSYSCSCGIGQRLWLQFNPLVWELPYASGMALKSKKEKKRKLTLQGWKYRKIKQSSQGQVREERVMKKIMCMAQTPMEEFREELNTTGFSKEATDYL